MRCMLQRCDFPLARAYAIGLYIDDSCLPGNFSFLILACQIMTGGHREECERERKGEGGRENDRESESQQ